MVFNRKRKDNRSSSFILDDSPKRTKVQAQRKFAQTSNVNSPVLTPVAEIEIQEKVMPEPIELLPMKRPNTEDFLTFLCFRGTPALPQNLNFFNNATMTEGPPPISDSPGSSKNGVILPANIGKQQGDKPFIAFGVRKRADPVVVSRHMDKKRRHALAIQALRRKYQEQKMAKIRAITISKLSEKVHTNKTVVRTTRSITKTEPVTKKSVAQKTKITVVATKHVKVTTRRTSIQQTAHPQVKPAGSNLKQKMTLRNLRNRVVKREIKTKQNLKKDLKQNLKNKLKELKTKSPKDKTANDESAAESAEDDEEETQEEEEDDDEYSSEVSEESQEETTPKKKLPTKATNLRVTRSNILQNKRILLRQQNLKGSPTSPRLRSQLRRKILQGKTELSVPLKAKRRILTRKVQIKSKTKTIAKKVLKEKVKIKDTKDLKDAKELKDNKEKESNDKKVKVEVKAEVKSEVKETRANTRENFRKKQEILNALKKEVKCKKIVRGKKVEDATDKEEMSKGKSDDKTDTKTKKIEVMSKKVDDTKKCDSKKQDIKNKNEDNDDGKKVLNKKLGMDDKNVKKVNVDDLVDKKVIIKKNAKNIDKQLKAKDDKETKDVKETKDNKESKKIIEEITKNIEKSPVMKKSITMKKIIATDEKMSNKNLEMKNPDVKIKEDASKSTVKCNKTINLMKTEQKTVVKDQDMKQEEKQVVKSLIAGTVKEKVEKEINKKAKSKDNKDIKDTKEIKEVKEKSTLKLLKVDTATTTAKNLLQNTIVENNKFIIDDDIIIEEIQPFKELPVSPLSSSKKSEENNKTPIKSPNRSVDSDFGVKSNKKCDKVEKVLSPKANKKKLSIDDKSEGKDKADKKLTKKSMDSCDKSDDNKNKDKDMKKDKETKEPVVVRERPARKTKLAAAIYMEILGRKLVNDDDIDDMSIDSFPELPNVRKMEQRENELKAKMKMNKKTGVGAVTKQDKCDLKDGKSDKVDKLDKKRKDFDSESETNNSSLNTLKVNKTKIEKCDKLDVKVDSQVDKTTEKRKSRLSLSPVDEAKILTKNLDKTKSLEDINNQKPVASDFDSDSEKLIMKKIKKQKFDEEFAATEAVTASINATAAASTSNATTVKKKKALTKKKSKKLDDTFSFSESDEEPLVKLTQKASDIEKSKSEAESTVKQKRECAKRPQNYLPLFSSSDEEEKFFRQSDRPVGKKKIAKTDAPVVTQEVLLSSKDIGKRFGKGKVNMSNEQIEKWLNDSAMAGVMLIKAENDEMLKFGERIPTETSLDNNLSTVNMEHLKNSLLKEEKLKSEPVLTSSVHTTPEKSTTSSQKPLSNEKKTIFRKAEQNLKNSNAFSACNESSVYAFEADNEDSVSTPFRRPSRRPSSTATSRSEDDPINRLSLGGLGILDSDHKAKFRLPAMATSSNMVSPLSTSIVNKSKEVLMLTDESNTSGPIAVQVNLDQTDNEPAGQNLQDNEHMFYLPFQPGTKGTIGSTIQSLSLKMGTESPHSKAVGAKFVRHNSSGSGSQMFPPSSPNMFKKMEKSKTCCSASETYSDDFKYKVPSSPSASSSSSAKLVNKRTKQTNEDLYKPVNDTDFPNMLTGAKIVEAPVFHPTEKEFVDPLEYIEKIRERAERFGVCRIVPPGNFKPECKVLDEMRFTAYNQYVHKMMHRWGPNFRELVAIRKYLATQSISLKHPPWIGGIEVDLPKLYQTVQILGGLKEVIEKKKWPRVSELMKIPKSAQDRVTKLDDMYCKYLLPYDTLSPDERKKLFDDVEADWAKREVKMLEKAKNGANIPEEEENEEESDEDEESESEGDIECIVKGRSMALSAFYRIARNTMAMWFKEGEPTAADVEEEFWKHVTERQHHICVHSGSIDSGNFGYGFAVSKNSPFARHAWNLKVLTNNSGSILRSMGPVMGLTVPTLHVGMLYAGCCWYRDPHSLPWIEYLHTGANKIWYGIPDSMSDKFHETMVKLVPHYCLNKSLWLPTDTVMVPPSTLVDHGVSLTKTLQEPGQFVVVFPKAFTSNICAGYVVSESVFWAPPDWLSCADKVFLELRNSCEPSMFSYERLLLSMAQDPRSDVKVLRRIIPPIERMIAREKTERAKIKELGIKKTERLPLLDAKRKKKMQDTDTEYICEDCRWNLYCSMICDSPDNGYYCLEHAIENLQEKRLELENLKLMYTYDDGELENFVAKIHESIEAKLIKKVGGKFAGMATLLNR